MDSFQGFYEETNEYLIGIRFNNYKEWFHEHRDMYNQYVQQPMKLFAQEVFDKMQGFDKDFADLPKISRANRDIRFSNNKNPYKESKWFFLRSDGSPRIIYPKPTYFFEITPDFWWYGLFFAPGPAGMGEYRKKIESDTANFERIIKNIERQKLFTIEGEEYKRLFNKDIDKKILPYYQKKEITFARRQDYTATEVYGRELTDIVADGFKRLYPMYRFLSDAALNIDKD